jgi:hypothetical protein
MREGIMNISLKHILFWTPRLAGILFILFLSLFALDIFDLRLGFWGTLAGLFIHLIPTILLTLALVIAWKREWVGAALFFGWAVWYAASARESDWIAYALLAGLPALIGLFFLAGWVLKRQGETPRQARS